MRDESEDVYKALVTDLALTIMPSSIMGVTLTGISLFAYLSTGITVLLISTVGGGIGSVGKVLVMLRQSRRNTLRKLSFDEVRRWERMHILLTVIIATCVGATTTVILNQPDLRLQMLATALLFGYCAGIVGRLAIRPRLANVALIIAVLPAISATAAAPDVVHRIVALMFGVFLVGAFESVRHVHCTAVRHIALSLDMATLARNDPLTGLANRLGLREAFRAAAGDQGVLAVHYLDLDGFKGINDRFGHAAGDTVLKMVADRLLSLAPIGATVARIGGDEFVLLQPDLRDDQDATVLAAQVEAALRVPFRLADHDPAISASLGYTVAPASCANLDDMLSLADTESYRIKRNGGGATVEIAGANRPRLYAIC